MLIEQMQTPAVNGDGAQLAPLSFDEAETRVADFLDQVDPETAEWRRTQRRQQQKHASAEHRKWQQQVTETPEAFGGQVIRVG